MAHQSLYRRYRPRRFADVRGQGHVIKALRNAVAQGTEGHAYLFSGPRGTGKTSTARILAKALNCPNLVDGEPCVECDSCRSIENGSSYDLFELDAASNNGVDAMRDLISRTVVGSPGRTKVYILDEVHMLSPAASNALLKTLEEPPDHVVFVLATTDPQKVLPTIRSRTQHFEFSLLSANELADYVRWIGTDAGLDIDETAVEHVVRHGRGSARDTLSALDMVVAAGGVSDRADSVDEIVAALSGRDTGRVMSAIADAVAQGREPRVLAENLLTTLRDAFLTSVHATLDHLSDADQTKMAETAAALGTATITRALESIGAAIVEMRQAADPRVPLEVALIRLTTPSASADLDDLLQRIEDLERRVARGAGSAGPAAIDADASDQRANTPIDSPNDAPRGAPSAPAAPQRPVAPGAASSPADIRAQLAARKNPGGPTSAPPIPSRRATGAAGAAGAAGDDPATRRPPEPPQAAAAGSAPPTVAAEESDRPQTVAGSGAPVTLEQLAAVMAESVIPTLGGMNKSLFNAGRFVGERDGMWEFALDNAPERVVSRAQGAIGDIEAILASRLGVAVRVHLTSTTAGASPQAIRRDVGPASTPAAPASQSSGERSAAGPPATTAAVSPEDAAPHDEDDDEYVDIDVHELEDANDTAISGLDKVIAAFPGAVVMEEDQ